MSAISAWSAPARTAETMQRSAPSSSRTSTNWRNQRLSVGQVGRRVGQRVDDEARRPPTDSRATAVEAVVERARPVLGAEVRQHVHQAGEHRQALAPAGLAVARAEVQPGAERLGGSSPLPSSAIAALAIDQRDVALQAILQALDAGERARRAAARGRSTPRRRRLDRVGAHVVGELVEGAAAARSKRAWCQWQVRMPSLTLPLWSGKPMCGQRLSTA